MHTRHMSIASSSRQKVGSRLSMADIQFEQLHSLLCKSTQALDSFGIEKS